MAKTTQDLAEAVLQRLTVIEAEGTPSAADSDFIKDKYANLYRELEEEDIAFWDEAEIPEKVFEALSDFMAGRCAPNYGQARPDFEESGHYRLSSLAQERSKGGVVAATYF